MATRNIHLTGDCRGISEVLARVGDKWTVLVVTYLGEGPMRFNELRRSVSGISQRMLTLTLRGLERDGFVTRTVFATIPPRVDYELTALGRDLLIPVTALSDWARNNQDRIRKARERFDAKAAKTAGRTGSAAAAGGRDAADVTAKPRIHVNALSR